MTEANKSARENAQTTTILVSEEKAVSKVEEKEEQIEPPPIQKLSNNKEMRLKLIPSSQSLLRHILNLKFHLFNVSKNHLT